MGLLNNAGMDRRLSSIVWARPRLDRTISVSATGGAALNAHASACRYRTEPEQFRDAKLILAWAANIHGTNIHLWPFIVEARRNGAKLYTIDPVRTRTAAPADRHFPICPEATWRWRSACRARHHRRRTPRPRLHRETYQRF